MINTKQDADNFVKEAKMKQKKRLDMERMAQGQRDYVSENKQDAAVWRDLDQFTRTELQN